MASSVDAIIFCIRMNIMKRFLAIAFALIISLVAFSGCNAGKNTASTVSEAASNVVSGADKVVNDAGDGLKKAGSAVDDNAEKMKNNGEVSDGDGVIGNEGSMVEHEVETQDTTDSVSESDMSSN